tara:strand:+ start:8346 stop:8516 length:171 start_codon:yes stop_codon:yes gene_type:complete
MANKYIPENIENLFIPGIDEDIKKAAENCTTAELTILVNNLVDVLNKIIKEQKGEE